MTEKPAVQKIPRPAWLRNGLVMAGGWEPVLFMVRRGCGGGPSFVRQYLRQYSVASLRRLKAAGVNLVTLNFFKGAGLKAEKADMNRAIRTAKAAHRLGLKVGVYLGDTILFESFLVEYPEAESWTQVAADGKPVWYNKNQTFRRRWCRNNPAYAEFMKEIIRLAVERADADLLHFDNYMHWPEPQGCHCVVCCQQFRDFIAKRYTPKMRRERFGFEVVDAILPPQYGEGPVELKIIQNPLIQEWIDFRAWRNAEIYAELASYAHSLKSDITVECNPGGIWCDNRVWHAVDHERLLRAGEAFWNEEAFPGLHEDGKLVTRIRSMKMARKMDQTMFCYSAPGHNNREAELAMAEALAFNQGNLAYVDSMAGNNLKEPVIGKYINFLRKNRGLYCDTVSCARLAVLRSYASLAYNSIDTNLAVRALEQLLIEARIPFDIIFESHLAGAGRDYDVLALANAEAMPEAKIQEVRRFVAAGGALLATGNTSLFNEHRWRRDDFALADVFGVSCPKTSLAASCRSMRKFGRGQCVYLPEIMLGASEQLNDKKGFWNQPTNAREIFECLQWLEGDRWVARVNAPSGILTEYLAQPARRRLFAHLVNYAVEKEPGDVIVRINRRRMPRVDRVWTLSPNWPKIKKLDLEKHADAWQSQLKADRVYTLVCFEGS